jgi:hypothetical protein
MKKFTVLLVNLSWEELLHAWMLRAFRATPKPCLETMALWQLELTIHDHISTWKEIVIFQIVCLVS